MRRLLSISVLLLLAVGMIFWKTEASNEDDNGRSDDYADDDVGDDDDREEGDRNGDGDGDGDGGEERRGQRLLI